MREDPKYFNTDFNYRGTAPVVEFRTQNGLYQYYSTTYRKNSHYKEGETVKIYYYKYKSRMEMALADDRVGKLPKTLLIWGIVLGSIGYPILLYKLSKFLLFS